MTVDSRISDFTHSASSVGRPDVSRRDFVRSGLGALAATAVLPACGKKTVTAPPEGRARLTARPGSPTLTPTTGLSELGLGGNRDGILYVPQSYSEDTATPLFVALHGAGGAGSNWASYYARAEDRGMIFLAPDSRSGTWDVIQGGYGPDVEFIDRALQHTFDHCRIDPARLALGGFSDGASYALSLGVSNGDLFSHLVAYSPGFITRIDPVGRPPVYVSHGTGDGILPVALSRDNIVPTLQNSGYDVTYEEFDGGHEVPAAISEAALDWFLGSG
jgi:phospholipase/carboxylesterase